VTRRLLALSPVVVLVAGVGAAAYWAGSTAILPPVIPAESHVIVTYRAEVGTVGRTLALPVSASWPITQTLLAGWDGLITTVVHPPGGLAQVGDVLATVNLEPVVVAPGAIPMFRTLRAGVQGQDVAQFQGLLRALDYLTASPDGRFGPTTIRATQRWQNAIGATADGSVEPGSLIFVESLPVRLDLVVAVGQRINPSSEFLRVLGDRPSFTATIAGSQRPELTSGMTIAIKAPSGSTWEGTLDTFEPLNDGRYSVVVSGVECGEGCQDVPIDGETALSGSVELVPETRGVVIPTSAMTLQPSAAMTVTLVDGSVRPVQILAEADGFAVVTGIDAGTPIQLPSPPSQ
jgi:peptidoglycan hydrolase-like protein with peptidoglycan-binding domain